MFALPVLLSSNFEENEFDFHRGNSGGAVEVINSWIAEKTNNKIPKLISENDVNRHTELILINAVYFKGDWLKKFDTDSTTSQVFHISPTESVKVQMMHMTQGKFLYGVNSALHCQAVELPYAGENLSMFVLLPDQALTSLFEVEKKLTANDLQNVKEKFHMSSQKVDLWLPRFSLDEKLSLAEMLAEMGMSDLFTDGAADLSGIDGSRKLYVSKVVHRAVVEVNEKGTEAAAATAVIMTFRSLPIHEKEIFRADHPFLFFIQDKATGSILFLGRLVRPPAV